MDSRQEVMLLMMSLGMLTILGAIQIQIRWRNRSAISHIGTIWGHWSARFNLFSWRGYVNWLALIALVVCGILVVKGLPRPTLVLLILSYGAIIFYSWPMSIVIGEKGILFQDEMIYWHDIEVWDWTKHGGLSCLTIWLKETERRISIPIPVRERLGLSCLLRRTLHLPKPNQSYRSHARSS